MKKKLEELDLLDDFLFGTLISHPIYGERFAKILIQTILNRDIKILKIVPQMNYYGQDTDEHGARLDVYIEEEDGVVQGDVRLSSIYDIEPDQNSDKASKDALPRRVRFYRSTIDARSLQTGADYNRLKNVIIIMLLPYDPFGFDMDSLTTALNGDGQHAGKYTVKNKCLEEPEMEYDDGALNLFLYTRGRSGIISQELKELLQYLENTTWSNAVNEPLREVQSMVDKVKYDKEVSISYMKSYERDWMMRNEGRSEGRTKECAESIKAFLSDLGTVPENISKQIDRETNLDTLRHWMKLAAKSDSIEEFMEKM